jgi:hypothetical protein
MKGGMPIIVTVSPLTQPTTRPTRRPAPIPAASPKPRTRTSAHRIPERATTDPTDRSMPPVRIAKLIPAARIAVNAFWRRTFITFSREKNASVVRPRTRHSTASAMKIP